MSKRVEVALIAVLEVGLGVFAVGTLETAHTLAWRLYPLVLEKDVLGVPGIFTVGALEHRGPIALMLLSLHLVRLLVTFRVTREAAMKWIAWMLLAGVELAIISFFFFMVVGAVASNT